MSTPGILSADIVGVSVWGPGLEGWKTSRLILSGAEPYLARPSPPPPPALLQPTERRRTGPVVRLALTVAQEAAISSGLTPSDLRSVFGSSNGDGVVVGGILDTLARAADGERVVSPTGFHNSVHNAAAGYWSIATQGREPATCLGCHDFTWAASLLTAMVDLAGDGRPVLLCCYDHPMPAPLDAARPTSDPFGAGLVLAAPGAGRRLAHLRVRYDPAPAIPTLPRNEALQALIAGNAIARAIPLLEALARGEADNQALTYLDGHLALSVHP